MCIKKALFFCFSLLIISPIYAQKSDPIIPIQHWQTSNGAQVYFVPTPEVPMLEVNVVFPAGSARDGDKSGLAQLTNAMLNQGTIHLNADQIAEQFDSVGAQFGATTIRDMSIINLQSLTDKKYLDPALKTFSQILSEANFPKAAFLRTQQQTLSAISAQQQTPDAVAKNTFFAKLYANQPYATPVLGLTDTVAKLTPEDLQKFYKQYYIANNAIITLVGAINRQQAEGIANELVQNLPKGNTATNLPLVQTNAETLQHIAFPSAQTTIMTGQIGITYQNPDYFPLFVGNYILGASPLTSRLFSEVREKRGLAYSVVSVFVPLQAQGPFVVVLQSRNTEAKQALQLVQQNIQKFVQDGPSPSEVAATKKKIINSFPLTLAGNDAISQNLIMIGFYHLPLDFLDTYRNKINAVTPEQIKTAFQKHILPNRMVTVMVGNGS